MAVTVEFSDKFAERSRISIGITKHNLALQWGLLTSLLNVRVCRTARAFAYAYVEIYVCVRGLSYSAYAFCVMYRVGFLCVFLLSQAVRYHYGMP